MRRQWSWWYFLVLVALAWRAIYAYWTPLVNKYVVPPGDDGPFHIAEVAGILAGKIHLFDESYPLGFHLITAAIARIAHWDALTAVLYVTPLLLILPIPALFWVGKRLFDSPAAGAFAAILWGFLALAPLRSFGNGNYPNLLVGSLFVPVALTLLVQIFRDWPTYKKSHVLTTTGTIVLIPLFHHLSALYFAMAAFPLLLWQVVSGLLHPATRKSALWLGGVSLLLVIGLTLALRAYYGPLLERFTDSIRSSGSLAPLFGPLARPIPFREFLQIHSPVFIGIGLIGFLTLLFSRLDRSVKVLFVGWIGLLWVTSISSFFGDPGRFVRELAIPFALTGGYLIAFLIEWAQKGTNRLVVPLLLLGLIMYDFIQSFRRPFALPEPFQPLIRVQHEEEFALPVLPLVTPPDGVILANNSNFYLPYLVDRKVIVATHPKDVAAALATEKVTTLFIGSRPPLTPEDVYTMFAYFDEIREALLAVPDKELVEQLPSGTEVYRITGPIQGMTVTSQ